MHNTTFTRRTFLAFTAVAPWAIRTIGASKIPMGIEMYSVRDELKKDPQGTVKAIAAMGYQGLEFYAPYFEWSPQQAKDMKKLLDDLGIRCFSTHNDSTYMNKENIQKAADLNLILGGKYVVMASSQPKPGLDGWKEIAEALNFAGEKLEASGLKAGYHNHETEFKPVDGVRPMEVLAKNTKPTVMLQLDVGTCLEAGSDPVAWIKANPGRIHSLHVKDWSPDPGKGFSVLFGEGAADWKAIFAAAESVGGAEYYLMEQEGSRYSELETAKKCLENYHAKGF
ncbi:MAG TPA: sugar phosphate isomerase/epimerase family protein [Candidatus Acidoferrum sp.]|nr:sugar phosphate isomerase/epimerase family protein [Candidatus Acidoferrum sp.]